MDLAYDLRVALRGFTGDTKDEKVKDVIDYVHHLPFFQNFSKAQVKELASQSDIIKRSKDKVILEEGEINDTLYIILSGKVRIKRDNKVIAFIGEGECFGEMAYIGSQVRVATVEADTDCILIRINATLLDGSSKSTQLLFFKNFAMTLVHRLSKITQHAG